MYDNELLGCHSRGQNILLDHFEYIHMGSFPRNFWFRVLSWAARRGSNRFFGWLTETYTQWWTTFNKIKMPGYSWHNVNHGIQIFREIKMFNWFILHHPLTLDPQVLRREKNTFPLPKTSAKCIDKGSTNILIKFVGAVLCSLGMTLGDGIIEMGSLISVGIVGSWSDRSHVVSQKSEYFNL